MTKALIKACSTVLKSASPTDKVAAANAALALLNEQNQDGPAIILNDESLPDRPSRPQYPELASPANVPKRRLGSESGRAALLHALAHIEFNAIDLAFDMAARFSEEIQRIGLNGSQFLTDWISIGQEEATHFTMVNNRLNDLGSYYGDLPAHDGLWEAALDTSDCVLARLAIAPMVLEARGLDVTPGMISKLKQNSDLESAEILQQIYDDEIGHVAAGHRWFRQVCELDNLDPVETFQKLVSERFKGKLKEPFNHEARQSAGLEIAYYSGTSI